MSAASGGEKGAGGQAHSTGCVFILESMVQAQT
jgi:hypothetical protein